VQASVDSVDGKHDPDTGHYGTMHYVGCPTRERAFKVKQALFRAAQRKGVSMSAKILPADDGTFFVEFKAINKAHARKYMLDRYGNDRSKWPYSPFAGDKNYG
jgi:hypothetical protein